MKKLSFTIVSNLSFNYVKHIVVFCVLLFISVVATAGGVEWSKDYFARCSVSVALGSGKVYVSSKKSNSPSYGEGNGEIAKTTQYVEGLLGGDPINFYLYSQPEDGYYFKGWTVNTSGEDIEEESNVNPYSIQLVPTGESESSPNPNKTYYAVFKQYVYGYGIGRSAEITVGEDYGLISLDKSKWDVSVSEQIGGDAIPKKQQGDGAENSEEDYITLTYYAKLKEGLVGAFFDGWYDVNNARISTDYVYNYHFYPTSTDRNLPSSPPTIYARFGKKAVYKNYATAQLVVADADGKYQEIPDGYEQYLDQVGGVYVNSNAETTPADEDYKVFAEFGDELVTPIADNTSEGNYSYTYRAKEKDGFVFVGWATKLPNVGEEIEVTNITSPYTHSFFTDVTDDANANAPNTLYAVFKKNTYYYYKGAIAGFTENGEKGKITITSQYYSREDEEFKLYEANTTDATIDNSENIYNTRLNIQTYTYTYKAEDTDSEGEDLTTFKGWSRSPRGGNIISTNTEYTETYTTSATTRDNASNTPALYAVFQSYWFKDPIASAVGAGRVAAKYSEDDPDESEWHNSIVATNNLNQVAASEDKHNYSVWYYADPNFGAYFKGWSQVADGSQLITDEKKNPYKVDYSVTATDNEAPFVSSRLYAVFESVIQLIQKDRMIYYVDKEGRENINDVNVIINFNKASTLTAELKDNRDIFRISDKQNVQQGPKLTLDASTGISHLVVSYIGDKPREDIGKTATITLSSEYTNENNDRGIATIDVEITIEEMPFVSFLPTDGKGVYTIKHTDGRGVDYSMPEDATDNINISIAQENMATFELNLIEDVDGDGLTFAGWQVIVDDIATYFSYDKKCTHSFKESAFVRPVFLADDRAVFTIIGDQLNRKYYDLQLALDDAKTLKIETNQAQVVVFSNEGNVEGTLYQGNYIIPEGVTLLIPGVGPTPIQVLDRNKKLIVDPFVMSNEKDKTDGNNNYVCRYKRQETISGNKTADVVLTVDDYTNVATEANVNGSYNAPYPACYRKLIVEDGTSITIESGANLELYSVVARSGQTYEAQPYRYGQIELGENCRIDVKSGASLYALGYITGAQSSRVTAQSGAEVHELFQYSDPRGGGGVAHLYLKKDYYKVFPFSQYYIQNVEVPLEIKSGAIEYITTTADVLVSYVVMAPFVISDNEPEEASGLFRLGDNSSLIKYYDPVTDRQKYIVKGETGDAKVKFGILEIQLGDVTEGLGSLGSIAGFLMDELKDVVLNSRDYVLPMNNNMDIYAENIDVTLSSKFAFLAGSTLTIDETSNLMLSSSAEIYLYDAVENLLPASLRIDKNGNLITNYGGGSGYFSAGNNPLNIISATPNNSHLLADGKTAKRLAKDIKDAKWIVNGKVVLEGNAGLYTTTSGAQIVSTKNGSIQFVKSLANKKTYQAKYISAQDKTKILDDEGVHNRAEYTVTSAKLQNADGTYTTTSQNTFTYDPAQGKWITGGTPIELVGANICVTMPDYNLLTLEIDPLQATITSKLVEAVTSATFAWNGGNATDATFSANENGKHINISYTPVNKAGEYEGLININNGQYYHKVRVTEDYTPHFSAIEKWQTYSYLGYSTEINADIVTEEDNVAGILSGRYASTWTYAITGDNADEFTFVWGEGDAKLAGAKIVLKPKTSGNKSALLSLTCAYTDAAGVKHTTTKAIPLSANELTLKDNNLAFADGVEHLFISDDATELLTGVNSSATIEVTSDKNGVVSITNDGGVYKIKPEAKGSVTITVTQAADLVNRFAATTITKTIIVTDDIVWNWEHLYFGSENTNPVTTKYENWSLEVAEDEYDVILDLIGDELGYLVKVQNWEAGEAEVTFTFSYGDNEDTKTFTSMVYRDPRHLPLGVTDRSIYEAVTWSFDKVGYNEGNVAVAFNPASNQVAQWSFMFFGIPDQLTFTAMGNKNWQIEESANGQNWSIAYTWAPISSSEPFALNLQPSTRYIRISYAVGNDVKGELTNIAVSELTSIKSDVDKLYMPMESDDNGGYKKAKRNVVFTYVNEDVYTLDVSNNVFSVEPAELNGKNDASYYKIERVEVGSTATQEITGSLDVKGTQTTVSIKTFYAPQAIPIQLASDHDERYYYVVSNSYQTTWDAATHAIVMQNAVADASPYVVFHFAEAPTPGIMSFNYSTLSSGAQWMIQESSDATNWIDLDIDENESAGSIMRKFKYPDESRYLRILLVSDYAEVVTLTNVSILPSANVVVNPASMTVYDDANEMLSVTTNNLQDVTFSISDGFKLVDEKGNALGSTELAAQFVGKGTKKETIYVEYSGENAVLEGTLNITSTKDAQGVEQPNPVVLATVELLGVKRTLSASTGIHTGVNSCKYTIKGFAIEDGAEYKDVNIASAFSGETALFDYVIIYGETITDDESNIITTPTSTLGSNAITPCYIYKNEDGKYKIHSIVDNANASRKSWTGAMSISDVGINTEDSDPEDLRVYITGFCPYASTGYSKSDNGVWHFKGDARDNIDIYLENCYVYSRYKTKRGNSFTRENGETYSDKVARGSGAVLLFENNTVETSVSSPLKITIHTRGTNLLKSHYGCLFESVVGRAFQVSSPVQIYMNSVGHFNTSYTELNFTDEWPTVDGSTTERTNGFLSLRKQVNNAPSIDMGNANTVVNFRGGQVELQNALNSSDNYESTLAISYRTGMYGPAKFRFVLSHGIGTDGTGGRVNFYDGTTTVIPMTVPERYRQYYLMDTDENGNELATTSCLRTPKKTFIYGGSHCMMRACPQPTDKGGAPTDGDVDMSQTDKDGKPIETITGNPLGLYEYTSTNGWGENGSYGLVTPTAFPGNLEHKETKKKLSDIHANYLGYPGYPGGKYGVSSVTPVDGKLNFWIPAGYVEGVAPEVNKTISYWKACMTYIEAKYGVYDGNIGGQTEIAFNNDGVQEEEIYNLLYCQIDENISNVITGKVGNKYVAPVLNPAPTTDPLEKYLQIEPTTVGKELQNYITNTTNYKVENKVYYIVPAKADVWMNFTAPFDVANVYVMETYDESYFANSNTESAILLKEQAEHNADFAAFFGVALALDSKKPFDDIFADYMGWAKQQDNHTSGTYTKRGKYGLTHYYRTAEGESNWDEASYYLYKNNGPWQLDEKGERFKTTWEFVIPSSEEGAVLMEKGEIYSMLFPYCTGCDEDEEGNVSERDYWDYWTGKFLIFESTDGGDDGHIINGANNLDNILSYNTGSDAILLGNSTFAQTTLNDSRVWAYGFSLNNEGFYSTEEDGVVGSINLNPTETFLLTGVQNPTPAGAKIKRIARDGSIIYHSGDSNNDDTQTGGEHVPTINGGSDLFVTSVAEGINIAVGEPQYVGVFSATGQLIYNGWVETSVDVNLVVDGVYVVVGENTSLKVLY